jgi:hypothetical protein
MRCCGALPYPSIVCGATPSLRAHLAIGVVAWALCALLTWLLNTGITILVSVLQKTNATFGSRFRWG